MLDQQIQLDRPSHGASAEARAGEQACREFAPVNRPAARPDRDLRIDLIRGLSLWMIFVDHIPGNLLGHITYRHFALSSAVDIFVFLSGISCCLLYGKLIRAAGFIRAQMKALRRVCQLYGGYVCVGLVTVGSYFAFRGVLDPDYVVGNDLTLLASQPLRAIGAMVWLFYTPQFMDILPLYMILVIAAPSMILLLMRSEAIAVGLSASLWLVAAAVPQINVPSLDTIGVVSLNPLSWQLLFCLGLLAGKRYFIDDRRFRPVPWLQALCWLVVIGGAAARHATWFGFTEFTAFASLVSEAPEPSNETIAAMVNVLAGAYLTACHMPSRSAMLQSRWLSPLLLCGRHSLEVFCAGIALSIVDAMIFRIYGTGLLLELAVNSASLSAMTAIALLRDSRRLSVAVDRHSWHDTGITAGASQQTSPL